MSSDTHYANLFSVQSHVELIIASGNDTSRFLQGQLSCNMNRLSSRYSLRGALCNLKGRVVADMRLLDAGEHILIQTTSGMSATILDRLAKYQVFFKTTLEAVSDIERFKLIHLSAPETALQNVFPVQDIPREPDHSCQHEGIYLTRVQAMPGSDQARFECLVDTTRQDLGDITDKLAQICEQRDPGVWQLIDILSGIAHIKPGQEEKFTPQLLNYDINGTIDFKKGCYTGQEVIARMHYRASAKRRLYRGHLPVLDLDDGDVVSSYAHEDGSYEVLAVASTDDGRRPAALTTLLEADGPASRSAS